jgi:hypothetical protein
VTTWQSNDDVRRDGGAEIAEFDDAPPASAAEPDDEAESEGVAEVASAEDADRERADREREE